MYYKKTIHRSKLNRLSKLWNSVLCRLDCFMHVAADLVPFSFIGIPRWCTQFPSSLVSYIVEFRLDESRVQKPESSLTRNCSHFRMWLPIWLSREGNLFMYLDIIILSTDRHIFFPTFWMSKILHNHDFMWKII